MFSIFCNATIINARNKVFAKKAVRTDTPLAGSVSCFCSSGEGLLLEAPVTPGAQATVT